DLVINDERNAERGTELDVEPILASGRLACAIDMRTAPGELPADTRVSLEIVDASAQRAASVPATLVSSADGARHIARATVDGSSLAPGTYVARAVVRTSAGANGEVARAFRIVR
ncbi:MAG TPA: hypothetical protein VGY57_07185, partial [Vicinamibacterales bacterium]|nr:hypothetical protein [Vicinamibacterales bacterium]